MSHDPSFSLRPSACPSLSRIVAARDGGLCRIKLPGGQLRAEQALALAEAIDHHASGVIELTNRANLQLRGVRAGHETALIERLMQARLGPPQTPLDYMAAAPSSPSAAPAEAAEAAVQRARAAATDDVRNLMVSPTAGGDTQALCDTRPLAEEILALLQSEPRFSALSPKFALLLDGGERLAMIDHPHDIWLSAMPPQGDDGWFAFGLAGCPSSAYPCALAAVRHENAAAFVRASLDTFLDLARPDDTRMRHLLAAYGEEAILERIGARVDFPLRRGADVDGWRRANAEPTLRFGAHRQRDTGLWHVGAQPPLGRIDSSTLRGLAQLALGQGNGSLTVTPWQSVLLTDVRESSIPSVEAGLDALGLVRDASEPFARLVACAGSAGCAKGIADTKADATALAPRLPVGIEVHLSGCMRSCAAAHCMPYTLLAVEPGCYDVYRQSAVSDRKTTASDHASQRSDNCIGQVASIAEPQEKDVASQRFGERIAARLTIEEAARLLGEAAARSQTHA
ncbi:precorrin-3B synthase [Trinickia symbiotica]|uniref:Precorrin-3B synthase n=1 Tax=Trinickia symbiotica TaxID=863227 RepID=A0A2T3XU95_9BURK|nr:precorrin-3B synthase [Trinickia symbiotica]PTB20065.1 precorrin-3B synthase [Trinickia symbiotica]